jgi:diadenosine tetraphosphate (Ap4A) HIT family hydrolase
LRLGPTPRERTKIDVHIPRGVRKQRRLCGDRSASVLSPVGLQHLPPSRRPENWVRAVGRPRPGGYIIEGEHFLVEHAPLQSSSAGTVIVEARRHLLDFGEMTSTESAELGSILHRLVPAVKAATEVERVYFLALMERVAHFHLWLIPKKNEGELRGVDYLAQRPPLTATPSAAEAMSQKIRAELEPP